MRILLAHAATLITIVLRPSIAASLPDSTPPPIAFGQVVQAGQTTEFSQPLATEILRVLAVDIGPRPMGSPAEQLALDFAVRKLNESGCDTAYIIPMDRTRGEFRGPINTKSGIAVGIQKGNTGKVIVLGAHIDSDGPEIPGANDDGSGTAVVLELARVLAQREWESTLVFALFGGEEMGLQGSERFVEEFLAVDSVVLMIQVDMADGTPKLLLLADTHGHNSPSWLVQAAFEEFAALGYDGLTYETHFNTISSLLRRPIASSDHEPFLRKGIPAIGFTSDIATPIHSPQDEFSRFLPEGLKRSGDLVYRLVKRFDRGVPQRKKDQYWLYHHGTTLLFLPRWLLWTFISITLGMALTAIFVIHKRTASDQLERKIRLSGGKLLVVLLVIMALAFGSELLLGLLKGWRNPWFLEPNLYFLLGALFGLIGIWIGIHLARRMKLSLRIDAYLLRSVIPLMVLTILFSLVSVNVAFTAATALLLVSLAFTVRNPILRTLFWLASPYLMVRLLFNEETIFLARVIAAAGTGGSFRDLTSYGFFILLSSVWMFPFLTSFVGIYKDTGRDLLFINPFSDKRVGIILAILIIGYTVYLVPRPSYSDTWRRKVRVDQDIDLSRETSSIRLRSSEYLKGVRITHSRGDTLLDGWTFRHELKRKGPIATDWLRRERSEAYEMDGIMRRYDLELRMHFARRPYQVQVTYVSDSSSFQDIHTPLAHSVRGNRVTFSWYSFPDTIVTVPVGFELASSDSVKESITATFADLAYPLVLEGENTNFILRTKLRTSEMLYTPPLTNSTSNSASTTVRHLQEP